MRGRIELALDYVHETADAYLLSEGDGVNFWVPKSQCEIETLDRERKTGVFWVSEWWAKQQGLI